MASKKQQQTPSSPNTAYIIMIVGGLAVLALVAWALNRSFNAPLSSSTIAAPAQPAASSPVGTTSPGRGSDEEAAKAAVARITPEDLHQRLSKNEVTLIDVRNKQSYDSGHIEGAVHIPLASVEAYLSYVPRGKPIVTYCT